MSDANGLSSLPLPCGHSAIKLLRNNIASLMLIPLERLLGYNDKIAAEYFHTWGCPLYILDDSLQIGTGIGPPKWDPRSRASVYLRHSLHHASNAALYLNLQTGCVSLQYHLVFDDKFTNIPYLYLAQTPPNWDTRVTKHFERATDEAFTIISTWYQGEMTHIDDQDDTNTSTDNKLDISTLGLRRSQHIKDLKKAEFDTSTALNEAGFILHTVKCHKSLVLSPKSKDKET
eukprot:15343087-Ditylum_brightwellii.AAC.1